MQTKKVYLAGPMQGIKDFNFPAFRKAAADLRNKGYVVFSPAEADERRHGKDVTLSETGDIKEAEAKGFDLRVALGEDLAFICKDADAIAILPKWENSKGVLAEWATAKALGLEIMYL